MPMLPLCQHTRVLYTTHIHTGDGERGLHAGVDVVGDVTVEQPRPRVPGDHLHGLENPGEEIEDVCTVHAVRLTHTTQQTHKHRGTTRKK